MDSINSKEGSKAAAKPKSSKASKRKGVSDELPEVLFDKGTPRLEVIDEPPEELFDR